MKTTKKLVILIVIAIAINGCKISNLTSSKLVNKTVDKVATKAIYGNYKWASDNLDVATFRNGDPIPEAKTDEEWEKAGKEGKPAWCYYKNDPKNGKKYGKLYNWHAVSDPRGLAPEGYKIPTEEEIEKLIKSTGRSAANAVTKELVKGGKTGFNSKLGGERDRNGVFHGLKEKTKYWTTDKSKDNNAVSLYVGGKYNMSGVTDYPCSKGLYVRCIKE